MNLAFAKIPLGVHTIHACIGTPLVCVFISFLLRAIVGTIVPFELVFVAIGGFVLTDIVFGMIKFIPVKNERTGKTKRWAMGTYKSILILLYCVITHMILQQERGFTCLHRIDLILKLELL